MKRFLLKVIAKLVRFLMVMALILPSSQTHANAKPHFESGNMDANANNFIGQINTQIDTKETISTNVEYANIIYGFPVKKAKITQGIKEHGKNAIDFAYPKTSDFPNDKKEIIAVADGDVIFSRWISTITCVKREDGNWYYPNTSKSCPADEANYVKIRHKNGEISYYYHLAYNSVPEKFRQASDSNPISVKQGELIGLQGNTGWSDGSHLHFEIRNSQNNLVKFTLYNGTKPLSIEKLVKGTQYTEYLSPCPQQLDNRIIIYEDPKFGCRQKGTNGGFEHYDLADGAVYSILLDASSISIPSGWHVTLRYDNNFFSRRCLSDNSFLWDMYYKNFFGFRMPFLPIDNNIKEIQVHQGPCTLNSSPETPKLKSSGDLSKSAQNTLSSLDEKANQTIQATSVTLNLAPELRWENSGDSDGDDLRFLVEVTGNNRTVTSGWVDNVVWRPSALDYQYGLYEWRVKARDDLNAESEWSETWTFVIQSPNKPPSISFNTANGDSFPTGVIYSNTRDWTFAGTASDPENQLSRVEWRCAGNGCGTQSSHSGAASWTHVRSGMSGRNEVYFVAYDSAGNSMPSRHLALNIDLATPVTTPSLNGQSNASQWPAWFNQSVEVRINAGDKGTGSALSGVDKVHYRLDGGAWQTVTESTAAFTVSSDGAHTVEYYSEDKVGNIEVARSFTFQVDRTPPSLPVNPRETNGLPNNEWQNTQNIPAFAWDPATDNLSGLRGYQLYFGSDPSGTGYANIFASAAKIWTPFPAGVPTGTYYLRARTQDIAGNWSAWGNLFTFRYDGTPPENPSNVVHQAGVGTEWQNTSNVANFTWPPAHDEGSGLKGYYVAWGLDPDATSVTFITANAYQDLTALCAANAACTGYLRLRSEDNVGNLAEAWNTVFILRYDNAPPVVDFNFNGGATQTNRSQVTLDVTASDPSNVSGQVGSGVYAARFSADGVTWEEWEQPSTQRLWLIPPISRQSWPVYVQVKDQVGLLSEIATHAIYLDVNPGRTSSANFILFDQTLSGGSGAHTSGSYQGRGTLGQVPDSPFTSSAHYKLWSGYEAGSQANPLVTPGHDEYTLLLDGSFGSGQVSEPLQSASYRLIVASGGIGLPASPSIGSANYQHQGGFLAQYKRTPPFEPEPVNQPDGDPTDPLPTAACDAPSVTINTGAVYTDNPLLSLSLCAPFASEMMISARDDFAGTAWEPFAADKAWALTSTGSTVAPYFIYAQFRDAAGNIHTGYFDDILYDPNQPQGALLLSDDIPLETSPAPAGLAALDFLTTSQPASALTPPVALDGSVTLYVDGSDDNSGVTEMQVSPDPAFADAAWQPFSPTVQYTPHTENGPKLVYARFRDEAGNISSVSVISFIYDTEAPVGYLYADPSVLPGDAVTTTLYTGDYEPWAEYYEGETPPTPTFDGGAVEMRVGTDPTLADAYWQPLAESVTVNLDPALPEGAFYAQYRDAAGNVSEIVSSTYQFDTFAPHLTAYAEPSEGTERTVNIYATDDLSGVTNLLLSNDPLMQEGLVTQPYTQTLTWTFDAQKVLWIVVEDGVGNRSQPYPVYATDLVPSGFTISGNAGTAGVVLSYVDGEEKAVTSSDEGFYTIAVPPGWSGTVTPSKDGYVFEPASRSYEGLTEDLIEQSYVAITPSGNFGKTAPTDVATNVSLSPTLEWAPNEGAASYEYCYSSAPGPCVKWNSVGTATSVTLSGLAPNYTYYWQVRSVNTSGTSEADAGTWWSFTTTTAPICTWPAYTPPISATFGDVPMTVGHWSWVERLANSTVTAGCGNGNFCPLTEVNRAQMAIFLLRSKHCGSSYTPPAVGDSTGFGDVSLTASYAAWVKQLAAEGITAGCGNGNFCPQTIVNRAQMAIFLLRAKHGATYSPPAVGASTGFSDVSLDASFAPWVKQLAAEGVTSGCGNGNFCPLTNVNRAQMATFLVRAFGLP